MKKFFDGKLNKAIPIIGILLILFSSYVMISNSGEASKTDEELLSDYSRQLSLYHEQNNNFPLNLFEVGTIQQSELSKRNVRYIVSDGQNQSYESFKGSSIGTSETGNLCSYTINIPKDSSDSTSTLVTAQVTDNKCDL